MTTSVIVESLPLPPPSGADSGSSTTVVTSSPSPSTSPPSRSPDASSTKLQPERMMTTDMDTSQNGKTDLNETTGKETAHDENNPIDKEEDVSLDANETMSDVDVPPPPLTTMDESTTPTTETPAAPTYTVRPVEDDARALELAKRRLQIQIAYVEKARRKILDETHPDFQARLVHVSANRDHLLDRAKLQESYWQHCTSVIFAYECEEATSEYEMNCDKLRQEMLEEIHQEIELINDQHKGTSSSARKTTRKTRSTRTKTATTAEEKASLAAADAAQKIKKRTGGNVFAPLEKRLAPSEVDHDLRELMGIVDAASKKRRHDHPNETPCVAKYHRANFFYRDTIFQEGDQVLVRNLMTGVEYVAMICSITTTELFLLTEMGTYDRVVVMDLRQGRVVLSTLTPEQNAALNEREDRDGHVLLRGH